VNRCVLLLWLALALPARAEEPVVPPPGTAYAFRQFVAILDAMQKHYVAPEQLWLADRMTPAFQGFIRSLDSEADLLTPEQFEAYKRNIATQVAGTVQITNLVPGITYCRLPGIATTGAKELRGQLLPWRKGQKLILDLRDNPGGSLDAAVQYARLFLPDQTRIVALDFARPDQRVGFVSDDSPKFTPAVVLLINGGTAAEAEILAAALRDTNRAQLVGSRTFGRGLHSEVFRLPDGSGLKVPTVRYLPPSKQSFQGTGVPPDVEVVTPPQADGTNDTVLARAVELLKQ
jgi:C-terminal peptidase prc